MPVVLYGCKSHWAEGPPADAPKTAAEALARIDQLYKDGVPFFTKESIRSALEQTQRPPPDDENVLIKGVDGSVVRFENRLDDALKRIVRLSEDEDLSCVKPAFMYDCRSHMKHRIWRGSFHENIPPFSSVTLCHDTSSRSLDFKKQGEEQISKIRKSVAELFEKSQQAWGESDGCKKLLAILNSSAADHEINKVVAVSLGSLVHPSHKYSQESSPFQHAMLLTLREWLIQRSAGSPCFTQDPVYTEVDHAILAEHGVEVIEDPRAWLEMDEQSIVVSISSNVPSREITADLTRPAVIIWNRVTGDDYDQEGKPSMTDPCSPRVRAMVEGYEMFDFGADRDRLGDVVVYVRRPKTLCREE